MFRVEIKINEWIDISKKIRVKTALIEENRSTKENRYSPDKIKLDILERKTELDIIQKIKIIEGPIDVRVFKGANLYFYGTIRDKKTIKYLPKHLIATIEAYDYVKGLEVINTQFWRFKNERMDVIATAICDSVGLQSVWPDEFEKRVNFYETHFNVTVLKVLNNFLFEYGWVLQSQYEGEEALISAAQFWDRKNTKATNITAKDILGKPNYKKGTKSEIKLLTANYRILSDIGNALLYSASDGQDTTIEAGEYWPEEGDSAPGREATPQYQKYRVLNRDNIEKTPDFLDYNSSLNWGSLSKDSEVIYASNQSVSYNAWTPGIFTHLEEHYPTESRVVLAKDVDRIYLGKEYRVIGDTLVKKLPPGCSERLTRAAFLEKFPQYVVVGTNDEGQPVNSKGEVVLEKWIQDRISAHNFNLGKNTPTSFWFTADFFPTRERALEAAAVEGEERRCLGVEEFVQEPIFQERDVLKTGNPSRFSDFRIRGDAVVSVGIGSTHAGVFYLAGDSEDISTREYTINFVGAGDSIDEIGRPITVMGYQFQDTPVVNIDLTGWHLLTENGTLATISRYIGDPSATLRRWNYRSDGVVEFKYEEGLMPVKWEDRLVTFEGKTGRIQSPVPIFDKRGTKAVFIKPFEKLEDKKIETTYLYKYEDSADFIQGQINEITSGNETLEYNAYAYPTPGKVTHPRVGAYVNVNMPEYGIYNERFVVQKYTLKLDTPNNPTVKILLKKSRAWTQGKNYPSLRDYFSELAVGVDQWDPPPGNETLYTYTWSNGIHPLAVPKANRKYNESSVVYNQSWRPYQRR